MHAIESAYRDGMLRHNPDKIEDLNSQDDDEEGEEEEEVSDSDVVVESKDTVLTNANQVLSRPPAQPPVAARESEVAAVDTEKTTKTAVSAVTSVEKVSEVVAMGATESAKVVALESSTATSAPVKVHEQRRISGGELGREVAPVDVKSRMEVSVTEEEKEKEGQTEERVSGESKDCDKIMSGANGSAAKGEGVVDVEAKVKDIMHSIDDDEIMELDSRDSGGQEVVLRVVEEVKASASVLLPKESESVRGANSAVGEQNKEKAKETSSTVDDESRLKEDAPAVNTEQVSVLLPQNNVNDKRDNDDDNNKERRTSTEGSSPEDQNGTAASGDCQLANALKRKRSPSPQKDTTANETREEKDKSKVSEDLSKTATATTAPTESAGSDDAERAAEPPTAKRSKLSETATELLERELEANFGRHDKLLREYITKSSAESAGDGGIQKHVDQLVMEIEALNDMIRTKEMEWNNMIHLKKVKEELVLRLTRKGHVRDILAAPVDRVMAVAQVSVVAPEVVAGSVFSGSQASSKAAAQANKLIQNLQLSSTLSGAAATSKTTQSILQNRANMTTEDLEKEKKNTAKLHR